MQSRNFLELFIEVFVCLPTQDVVPPTTDSYRNATITCLSSGLHPQALTQPFVHPLQEVPTFELLFHARNSSPSSPGTILPIFPEEFVLDHCRSPAVSCPSTSQFFPVFLLAKRLLLHFVRWIPLLSFSAFKEVPVFVNSKSPSMTQRLYKVLIYRTGLPLPKPYP